MSVTPMTSTKITPSVGYVAICTNSAAKERSMRSLFSLSLARIADSLFLSKIATLPPQGIIDIRGTCPRSTSVCYFTTPQQGFLSQMPGGFFSCLSDCTDSHLFPGGRLDGLYCFQASKGASFHNSVDRFPMVFDKESSFEEAVITVLKQHGWDDAEGVLHRPTEQDLIDNWAKILFKCGH